MFNSPISRGPRQNASAITKLIGDPSSPSDGDIWYNVLTGQLRANIGGVVTSVSSGTSKIVQVVNTQTGAVATGTTTIPRDDTIPQNTEGTEFMTLSITPTSTTNKLRIDVVIYMTASVAVTLIAALFQDSVANALAAGMTFDDFSVIFTHYMTAGTTSPITFKVRAGGNSASTITFNGVSGGRIFGGVMASSITITEIIP